MTTARLELVLFRVLPVSVLVVAFAGICQVAGTPWPWTAVVHEDGVRTLLDTLFYFEHGTRELVPDLVLAFAVAGAVRYYYPPAAGADSSGMARRHGSIAIAVLVLILAGTWLDGGWHAVIDNLLQQHTRSGEPLVWGAHWRYHLLERLAQVLLALAAVGILWLVDGRRAGPGAGSANWFLGALAAFAVLTVVFRLTSEPFRDPRFLGHQARELLTHTLVTLPLALGACLSAARRQGARSVTHLPVWPVAAAAAGAALCGAFLLLASLSTGAQSHGQSDSLAALVFPHFAEHALGYALVPSLAVVLYLARPKR